ncbi:MAG: hypothetical protein QXK11_11790 [Pyrobaculum sp.]
MSRIAAPPWGGDPTLALQLDPAGAEGGMEASRVHRVSTPSALTGKVV